MTSFTHRNQLTKKLGVTARGTALFETMAGLLVLIPVVLLLVDVIALVIAQSINDDLAKQAARYAAQTTLQTTTDKNGNTIPDTATMQTAAQTAATKYLSSTPWAEATGGLVHPAQGEGNDPLFQSCNCNFNSNPPQVQVITKIQCNLPVALPFWGTVSTSFQAQATEPIVGLQPTPQ